ncbi:hypothetical protein G6688_01655 [Polynucleobacter paneuropaeus]|nr:hypothetical protein G6688_01655 [Polynucleobacter paneuropaeus]
MGKLSIVVSTISFFALFLLNPIGMYMNRHLHEWCNVGGIHKYLLNFFLYLIGVSFFAAAVLVVTSGWHEVNISLHWLLFLIVGNLVFATINQVSISNLNLLGYRGWFTTLNVATVVLNLLCAFFLSKLFPNRAEYWLSGLLLGQTLVGFIGLYLFFKKIKYVKQSARENSFSSSKAILKYSWPISVAVILGWIQSQSYRYQMESALGLYDLGLFVAGYGLSSGLIAGFDSIITAYFQPIFYEKLARKENEGENLAWIEYASFAIPSLLLTGFFIAAAAPELVRLILGPVYQGSVIFVIYGAFGEIARTAISVFGMAAHARMNTRWLLYPNAVGAIATPILVLFFIPIFSMNGVGMALVLSGLMALTAAMYITNLNIKIASLRGAALQGLILGLILLGISNLAKFSIGSLNDSFILVLAILGLQGVIFLIFQYVVLRKGIH